MAYLSPEYDYLFKVVLVGDVSVGKSSMIRGITQHIGFPPGPPVISNIGIDFAIRSFQVDDKVAKLQIWDTFGQERFRTMNAAYYRGCSGLLLLYDISNALSFTHLSRWLDEVKEHSTENVQIMVLGNKCDLVKSRQVSTEIGRMFAEEHGLKFMETNVVTGENVEKAFLILTRDMRCIADTLSNQNEPEQESQGQDTDINSTTNSCSVA
ncbi:ras-related protein Rab-8A-like [Halichondria panicea]|uniref:ras-related protein Rab-8A-like n=1 Tax=Halichondria panicea TaxID=6063 RepID=UPI00312B3759